mgnify:FL=1
MGARYTIRYFAKKPFLLHLSTMLYMNHIPISQNTYSYIFAAFVIYMISVSLIVLTLIIFFVPHYGRTHVIVCISICSLAGSLTVCMHVDEICLFVSMFKSWLSKLNVVHE